MALPGKLPQIELLLLGYPRLLANGVELRLGLRKALAILAYMLEAPKPLSRVKLATLLWPDSPEGTSRQRLRRLLYNLTQKVGGQLISGDAELLYLNPDAAINTDTQTFSELALSALQADAKTPIDDDSVIQQLRAAASIYRGPFLDGFDLADSEYFNNWLTERRTALQRQYIRVLRQLSERLSATRQSNDAVDYAHKLLAIDPLREGTYQLLMQIHAANNNKVELDAIYQVCRQRLQTELGVEPCRDTENIYQQLVQRHFIQPQVNQTVLTTISAPPAIHFTKNEGVAYSLFGQGDKTVIVIPGFVSHIEMAWDEPRLRRFFLQIAKNHRVVIFDRRGVGVSERVAVTPSINSAVADVKAIMDHAGIDKAILFGSSEGGPAAIEFAHHYASRVDGLFLFGTLAKGAWSADYPWALKDSQFAVWREKLVQHWGTAVSLETFAPSCASDPSVNAWWARMLRFAASPASVAAIIDALRCTDVRELLPGISIPAVVVHRTGDRAVRIDAGRHLAQSIPGAQFVELPGDDHWWWCADQQAIIDALNHFAQL